MTVPGVVGMDDPTVPGITCSDVIGSVTIPQLPEGQPNPTMPGAVGIPGE